MPHISKRNHNQKALLWEKTGDDYQGMPMIDTPVVVRCRWEDANAQSMGSDGSVIGLDATVYCSREIPIDSLMKLGDLTHLTGTGFVDTDTDVYQVKRMWKTPSLNNRATMYRYGLMRFGGSLPSNVG